MPDLLAIVSKAVFEKAAGKAPTLGARLGMDRYVSANKNLAPLGGGGRLYLVTVRPPDEALWLVAVLDHPTFDGTQWLVDAACTTPLTDISALKDQIRFESGKGISAAPGALGMSLQTPRALAPGDAALLDAAVAGAPAPAAPSAEETRTAQLLAQVIADPTSDGPRLVYADELSERADPRGELIQVELALAGPLSIRKRDLLKLRRAELLKQHRAAWWPYRVTYRAHRGFIEAIEGSFAQIAAAAPALFAAEPVVEAEITDANAAKLAKAPWLARLRRLTVRGIDDEGFAALVASPHAQRLESLNVSANELSAEALEALEDHLPALRRLVLTANPVGDDGIAALVAWPGLARLEALFVSECELTTDGVAALVAQPLPQLATLTLARNDLDDQVAAQLTAARLPALRLLDLQNTGLSSDSIAQLSLPNLSRLDLRQNGIDPDDAKPLPFLRI